MVTIFYDNSSFNILCSFSAEYEQAQPEFKSVHHVVFKLPKLKSISHYQHQ